MSEATVNRGEMPVTQVPNDLPIPEVPKCLRLRTVTKSLISYAESKKFDNYRVAAHACIWAPQQEASDFGKLRAAIMMHLRFDGTLGFPGGLINAGEDLVEGLNREMTEECGWSHISNPVTWANYYSTRVEHNRELVLHFFTKQVTLEQFVDLEKHGLLARDYGNEVLGNVRVPLYTMDNLYNGLPAFLNNRFVGTAKQELLLALHHLHLLSEEEVSDVVYKSQNLKLSPNRM